MPTACAFPPTRRSCSRGPADPTGFTRSTASLGLTGLPGLTSPTLLMGYLGLVSHMGLMRFLRLRDARRGADLQRDARKPAAGAFWADGPAAPAPAAPAAADLAAQDRRHAGRHARRNPGHHHSPGQHARASLAALAFG